jgi:hypothetical protein
MTIIENGGIYNQYNIPTRININNLINEKNVELLKYITKILNIKFIFEDDVYSYYIFFTVRFESKIINQVLEHRLKYDPNIYSEYINKDIYFNEILNHTLQSLDNEILRRIRYGIILHKELPYKYLQSKIKEHEKI